MLLMRSLVKTIDYDLNACSRFLFASSSGRTLGSRRHLRAIKKTPLGSI